MILRNEGDTMRKRPFPAVLLLVLALVISVPGTGKAQVIDLNSQEIPELILENETLQEAIFAIIQSVPKE